MNLAHRLTWSVLLLAAAAVPWVFTTPYLQHLAVTILISGIIAVGIGLLVGHTGMVSLGHAAFVGIGAYTSALVTMRLGWPFWVALPLAGLLSGLVGFLFALPVLRLKGHFLSMATLGFVELIQAVFLNWESLTNGPNGLPGVPPASLFGVVFTTDRQYYYLALGVLALTMIFVEWLRRSRVGRAMTMLREDEIAAASLGVNTGWYKTLAFALSAMVAGLAGSLLGHYSAYVSPEPFGSISSLTHLGMVVLGGIAHPVGPLVGAVVLEVLPELLRSLADYRMLIYGALLMLMLPLRPEGLLRGSSSLKLREPSLRQEVKRA